MDPRAGLDDVEKRKFSPLPGLELQSLRDAARDQLLYRLSYPGFSSFMLYISKLKYVKAARDTEICHCFGLRRKSKKKNPGLYSASELYRSSDRRLLAKLVPRGRSDASRCLITISGSQRTYYYLRAITVRPPTYQWARNKRERYIVSVYDLKCSCCGVLTPYSFVGGYQLQPLSSVLWRQSL
jgi:hypothetical protein